MNELANPDNYYNLILELKTKIRQAKLRASLAVNNVLVLLYWQISNSILSQEKT